MPEPVSPQPQGSWTDLLLPLAVGAGSFASGLGAGRNPSVDNPAASFLQMMQIPSLYAGIEQKNALAQHQADMRQYYQNLYTHQANQDQQARINNAVTATKQAVELGNVDAVLASKDQLGNMFEPLFATVKARNEMLARKGWVPLWQPQQAQGQVQPVGGLPQVPPVGPGSPAMPMPQQGNMGYRPDVTESFSAGGLTESRKTPGTTEPQMVTEFLGQYPSVPSPVQLQQDLARTNQVRQARGLPTIPWGKEAQDIYEKRLFWERPDLYRRMKLTESASQMPPEVAGIALGQEGGNPFEIERGRLRQDFAKRQRIEAETPKKPDAGELETLRQQKVVINELQNLQNMAIRNFQGQTPTGPIRNKLEGFKQYFGWSPKDVVTFRSGIQNLMNVNLRATSGQNVTAPEEARAKAAFPTLNDPPETLLPKLNYALKYMRMAEQAGRGILQEDGLRLLHHMATPEGIAETMQAPLEEQRVIQYRRDPATGKLVEVGQ